MVRRASAGGPAAVGGFNFQHSVAAWVSVYILAQKNATPLWNLPSSTTFEWLWCETGQPVDDLLVGTSQEGLIFCQVKRTLELSESPDSDLASALDQLVRQFIQCRGGAEHSYLIDRLLDHRDRLVLITSTSSSRTIRNDLSNVLSRIRTLRSDQPLECSAVNKNERRALRVLVRHVDRSWRSCTGSSPSEDALRGLLSLVYLQVLDLGSGGAHEQNASILLRNLLEDPDLAETAWATLVQHCAGLAAQRSGASRSDLQQVVVKAGINLKTPRSYQHDAETLREYSERIVRVLTEASRLRVGTTEIKIERSCIQALLQAAEEGSLLVVSEPGVGKSVALLDLVHLLQRKRGDYVFLSVDRLSAANAGALRQELNLEHDLCEVLENWPGLQPAFLIIDALDAARTEVASTMLRDLIRLVARSTRWRVVASIRKFDLRYGRETRDIFAGSPPTEFSDNEFGKVRHFNIPHLSESELEQVGSQCPELYSLACAAPPAFRELLRVPFNLRLAAELLDAGVGPAELAPTRTQLELLDRYWEIRVIAHNAAKEAVLGVVCREMVEHRSLRISRQSVDRPDTSAALNDLLSAQVLVEWQPSPAVKPDRYQLTFPHHVLFDYAVSRLILRGLSKDLVERLERDPDLFISIQPSLVFHYDHLWYSDRSRRQFWDLTFQVGRSSKIPEIGKLIGPSVAAELAASMPDLQPLCDALEDRDPQLQTAAEGALRHIVGTLIARGSNDLPVVGVGAGPWCELLDRLSERLRLSLAYLLSSLLMQVCANPDSLTPEQKRGAGRAARRLLEFAWSLKPRDRWLVIHALQGVCRTYESDPVASADLIRRCLDPSHLSQFGFEEMPWLAREVRRLISVDPGLVEAIYREAFCYCEYSEELTPLGQIRFVLMWSNRKQDYGRALDELVKAFPDFLSHAPAEAVRALVGALECYVNQRYGAVLESRHEGRFALHGVQARIKLDYILLRDEYGGSTHGRDPALQMLDVFQLHLEHLAEQPERAGELSNVLRIVASENYHASIWRFLLRLGARFPSLVGQQLLPLTWSIPILTFEDTRKAASAFIGAVFPLLDDEHRRHIEEVICGIPQGPVEHQGKGAEQIRDELLSYLRTDLVVTEEAQCLIRNLEERRRAHPSEGRHFTQPSSDLEEDLTYGDHIPGSEVESNGKPLELTRAIQEFVEKYSGKKAVPSVEECTEILPTLRNLREALLADGDDDHSLRTHAQSWDILADACAVIAQVDQLPCDHEAPSLARTVLLDASRHPHPVPAPRADAQFEESGLYMSAPRISAAIGLIALARHGNCVDDQLLEAIRRLSNDSAAVVRYWILRNLNTLYDTAPELMWRILEGVPQRETSPRVLESTLIGPLPQLAPADPNRVAAIALSIYERVRERPQARVARGRCVELLTDLYVWRNQAQCAAFVEKIASNPSARAEEAQRLLTRLREPMTYGPVDPPSPEADAVRRRALDLLQRLLDSTLQALQKLEQEHTGAHFSAWPHHAQDTARSLSQLLDEIGVEIYSASGAFDGAQPNATVASRLPGPEHERFYREVRPILDNLAQIGLFSVVHSLLETLEFFIPVDPRGVFLRIVEAVRTGQKGGYQYDSGACNLMVRLTQRYLAEHRPLLNRDVECRRALIEVLDIFVRVGWPSALQLTYRLEEIFR